MTTYDTGLTGIFFKLVTCYSHLSEIEIDDFFSFSGPAQSNRKPSLLPMWASKDRDTGQIGESVFLDRSKVTFGWAAIPSKAAVPG